jgi:hypothetical protein
MFLMQHLLLDLLVLDDLELLVLEGEVLLVAGKFEQVLAHAVVAFVHGGYLLPALVEHPLQLRILRFDVLVLLHEFLQLDDGEFELAEAGLDLVLPLEVGVDDDFDEAEVVFDAEEIFVAE